MQLMPRTAAEMGRDRRFRRGKGRDALFNPKINIELGSKYLSHLMYNGDKVRNLFKTLAAYNAGPGKVGEMGVKDQLPKRPTNVYGVYTLSGDTEFYRAGFY